MVNHPLSADSNEATAAQASSFGDGSVASRSGGRGGRAGLAFAALAAVVGMSLSVMVPAAVAEDDRQKVADKVAASEARVEELRASMEGIDAAIAKVFLELEGLKAEIPVAEKTRDEAQERFEAAEREHQVVAEQLASAQAEHQRLTQEIEAAEQAEIDARAAIGNLARTLYLEGDPSALSVVLTDENARDIARRVAAADAMTRLQNAALNSALDIQEQTKNQVTRQGAVTERVADLEEKARDKAAQAAAAEQEAQAKVDELQTLKAQADVKQKEWASKKQSAVAQLKKEEADAAAMRKRLAAIDEENRQRNVVYSSGNGAFGAPLRGGLNVTSSFGWRIHPVLGTARLHNGTDFAANCGTPVYPAAPGVVSAVTVEEAGGNVVYVNHGLKNGNSYVTAYVHLEGTNVSPGQSVGTDSVVGWVGATGYATGCHLHFSVMENGADVDPMNYL